MGADVDKVEFTDAEVEAFAAKLRADVRALQRLVARPGFGVGAGSLGAELELFLVDRKGRPLPIGRDLLVERRDLPLALELDRFNLEYNSPPVALQGRPFTLLADSIRDGLRAISRTADRCGGRPAIVGILPTLTRDDLGAGAISALKRFRAMARRIRRTRGGPFRIEIRGPEALSMECDEVSLEGANTSFQVHLRVPPERFAAVFNAAQLASAPVLALAANSPVFLGCKLWNETRIALFRQAVDERDPESTWLPARVSFGHGWVRHDAVELFAEMVALHAPLLPQISEEDPEQIVDGGGVPELPELRLHAGTVWTWNRPVYDPADGGHLRVEMRALPSGPTVVDMAANAAFLVGLTLSLAEDIDEWLPALPFRYARESCLAAAEDGLAARIFWPRGAAPSPQRRAVVELLPELLDRARQGLALAGVETGEGERYLGICRDRLLSGRTGARWQLDVLDAFEHRMSRPRALAAMLERYMDLSASDQPVHQWPVEG